MSCNRIESIREVEEKIKLSKSIKQFIEKNRTNISLMNNYLQLVHPAIDMINNTIKEWKYTNQKIRIGNIVEDIEIDLYIDNLYTILPFIPKDVRTCTSNNIFALEEEREFIHRYTRIGRYKVEVFKDPSYENCSFCKMKSKNNIKYKGHIPYSTKLVDRSFLCSPELLPIGSVLVETNYPSMNNEKLKLKYHVNKNRLNNSTLVGIIKCIYCHKE